MHANVGTKSSFMLVLGLASVFAMAACQSKFNEAPPAGVPDGPAALEQRKAQSDEMQRILDQADQRVRFVKNLVGKIQQYGTNSAAFTPVELFGKLAEELKKPLPSRIDKEWVKEAQVTLDHPSVAPECRVIAARLATKEKVVQARDKSIESASDATLSIRTCKSNGQFVNAFDIRQRGSNFTFRARQDAMKEIFRDILPADMPLNLACNVKTAESGTGLQELQCQRWPIQLQGQQILLIDQMIVSNEPTAVAPMTVEGWILENGVRKLQVSLRLNADGTTLVKGQPQETTPAPVAPPTEQAPTPVVAVEQKPAPAAPPTPVTPVAAPTPAPEAPIVVAPPAPTPQPTPSNPAVAPAGAGDEPEVVEPPVERIGG